MPDQRGLRLDVSCVVVHETLRGVFLQIEVRLVVVQRCDVGLRDRAEVGLTRPVEV